MANTNEDLLTQTIRSKIKNYFFPLENKILKKEEFDKFIQSCDLQMIFDRQEHKNNLWENFTKLSKATDIPSEICIDVILKYLEENSSYLLSKQIYPFEQNSMLFASETISESKLLRNFPKQTFREDYEIGNSFIFKNEGENNIGKGHISKPSLLIEEIKIEKLAELRKLLDLINFQKRDFVLLSEIETTLKNCNYLNLTIEDVRQFLLSISSEILRQSKLIEGTGEKKLFLNFELYSQAISQIEEKLIRSSRVFKPNLLEENFDMELRSNIYQIQNVYSKDYENLMVIAEISKSLNSLSEKIHSKYEENLTSIPNEDLNKLKKEEKEQIRQLNQIVKDMIEINQIKRSNVFSIETNIRNLELSRNKVSFFEDDTVLVNKIEANERKLFKIDNSSQRDVHINLHSLDGKKLFEREGRRKHKNNNQKFYNFIPSENKKLKNSSFELSNNSIKFEENNDCINLRLTGRNSLIKKNSKFERILEEEELKKIELRESEIKNNRINFDTDNDINTINFNKSKLLPDNDDRKTIRNLTNTIYEIKRNSDENETIEERKQDNKNSKLKQTLILDKIEEEKQNFKKYSIKKQQIDDFSINHNLKNENLFDHDYIKVLNDKNIQKHLQQSSDYPDKYQIFSDYVYILKKKNEKSNLIVMVITCI